jgi:hypothetical protein
MSFRLSNPRRADSSPASRLEWMHELANWYGCVPVIFASIAESRRWRHRLCRFTSSTSSLNSMAEPMIRAGSRLPVIAVMPLRGLI